MKKCISFLTSGPAVIIQSSIQVAPKLIHRFIFVDQRLSKSRIRERAQYERLTAKQKTANEKKK